MNRYSYCLNNPLKYTDPSGYIQIPLMQAPEGSPIYHGGSSSVFPKMGTLDSPTSDLEYDIALAQSFDGILGGIFYMDAMRTSVSNGYYNRGSMQELSRSFVYTNGNFTGVNIYYGYVIDSGMSADPQGGGGSNLVDGASFLATFASMGYSARAYDTYNSSGWKNKSGRFFSSDLLKRGSNGNYVRGVQGYRNSAKLARNMSNSLKATGKAFGVLGVGITVVDAFSDGNLTWGDGAKIGIGLITTFTPIGWGYGIVDFGTYVMTGTSLTDRAGNYIDGL